MKQPNPVTKAVPAPGPAAGPVFPNNGGPNPLYNPKANTRGGFYPERAR